MINDVSKKTVLLLMRLFATCPNNLYNKDFVSE